jgi:CRP-like cAMP-binding protein
MDYNFNKEKFIEGLRSKCSKAKIKSFVKDETITTYIEKRNQLCIILDGEADLIRYDFNGNQTIIGHFTKHDIFGEIFYPANTNNELFVVAKKNTEVIFLLYEDILTKCKRTCAFHEELYSSLIEIVLNSVIELNTRIEVLSKRSIRDKLLSYFELLNSKTLSKTITLPFSLTDLADYLCIDRSAMMRELGHLKEDGFIKKRGNKITLLY